MAKLYILAEIGWEYNDSTYDRVGGSAPVKAYRSKHKAQEECDRRNGESLRVNKYFIDEEGNPCQEYEVLEIDEPEGDE